MKLLQFRVGDRVRVRQRTWVVQDVDAYESCRVLTLGGRSSDGMPRVWRAIDPFDEIEPAATARPTRRVGIVSWRRACRALIAEDGDSAALRTAAAADIELLPYQLEPALALITGVGSRVLVADEVGLGKTVQALLALAELHARGVVARALIICQAGLRDQWVDEAAARFALRADLIDQRAMRRLRTRLPPGTNPWSTESIVVSSIDFVKRPEVLPAVVSAGWDMVIVDEAHGACGNSDRRHAVLQLCAHASFVLLLTATPHNGDEEAFASLCSTGRHDDDLVVFRRSRSEAGRDAGRRAHTVRVEPTAAERRMHAALAALTRAVRRESADTDRQAWLLLTLLHKRALSSPHALAVSAERRLQLLGDTADSAMQLLLPLDDEGGELDAADVAPMWSTPALHDVGRERRLLENLVSSAREAAGHEGKLQRLYRLLRRVREPVIVFTEYRDTLQHIRNQVAPHAAVVHGGMTREQRRAALESFPRAGILLATDAAGEGLNLQQHCRCVINLELPWNPMRLEQRIGRVDRIGQRRRVHVFHLVSSHRETRLLERLAGRVSRADARVGAPNPLIGRPEWTEEASARLIVLRDRAAGSPRPAPMAVPSLPLTRLDGEAESECRRTAFIRALTTAYHHSARGGTDTAASGALIASARRAPVRAALDGRVLAIYRSRLTDGGGRVIATHVQAILCTATSLENLRNLATRLRDRHSHRRWLEHSVRVHQRMVTRLRARARAIAALSSSDWREFQPGLFDRRAEREWHHVDDLHVVAHAQAHERLLRADVSFTVDVSEPELALVLLPAPHATVS